MDKLLSIIVPSYNMEKYLPRCLGSLIVEDAALLNLLDIIVVNDGSKDRTSEIAHEFEAKYPGIIRVIDKSNGNYGSCINTALRFLKGRYVKVLDADDSYNTRSLEKLLAHLSTCNSDLILTDWVDVDESENELRRGIVFSSHPNGTITIPVLLRQNPSLLMFTLTYKSSIFKEMHYQQKEGISYTDVEWAFLPLAQVKNAEYFPEPIYRYLVGRLGQTSGTEVKRKSYWMVVEMFLDLISKYEPIRNTLLQEKRDAMDMFAARYAEGIYRTGKRIRAKIDFNKYDSALKVLSPVIYEMSAHMPRGRLKINVVALWRRNSIVSRFLVEVYSFVCRTRERLKVGHSL